jgi:hypothetical protein
MVSGEKPLNISCPLSVDLGNVILVFWLSVEPNDGIEILSWNGPVGQLQCISLKGIDDSAVSTGMDPGAVHAVIAVYMAVEEILGLVFIQ